MDVAPRLHPYGFFRSTTIRYYLPDPEDIEYDGPKYSFCPFAARPGIPVAILLSIQRYSTQMHGYELDFRTTITCQNQIRQWGNPYLKFGFHGADFATASV